MMREFGKKIVYKNRYFYWMWGVVCGGLTLLFERAVRVEITDFPQHIHCANGLFTEGEVYVLQGTAYQSYLLFHRLTKILSKVLFMDIELAAAVLMAATCAVSVLLMRWGVGKLFGTLSVWQRYLTDGICIGSIFFENLTGPLTGGRYYLLQGAPNPWHNPTFLMARPFGILTFVFFALWIRRLWVGEHVWKEGILYGIFALAGAYAKPTYAFVLLPAFAVATLATMLRRRVLWPGWRVLAVTAPVILLLLWQFTICFAGSLPQWMRPRQSYSLEELTEMESNKTASKAGDVQEEESRPESKEAADQEMPQPSRFGFRFGQKFGAFDYFTLWQALAVTLAACALPLLSVALSFRYREICGGIAYKLSMLCLFIGWIERFCFTNGPHGDFAWGYFGAIQLATVFSLVNILRSRAHGALKAVALGVFTWQLGGGLVYLYHIYYSGAFFV